MWYGRFLPRLSPPSTITRAMKRENTVEWIRLQSSHSHKNVCSVSDGNLSAFVICPSVDLERSLGAPDFMIASFSAWVSRRFLSGRFIPSDGQPKPQPYTALKIGEAWYYKNGHDTVTEPQT